MFTIHTLSLGEVEKIIRDIEAQALINGGHPIAIVVRGRDMAKIIACGGTSSKRSKERIEAIKASLDALKDGIDWSNSVIVMDHKNEIVGSIGVTGRDSVENCNLARKGIEKFSYLYGTKDQD
jgi:uncharacterized protein GlcG (DUF336 family)